MWQYIVTFIGSLVAALIAVRVSLRWSAKSRDKTALESLRREISTNITLCEVICSNLDKDMEWLKEGKTGVTPLVQLHTWVWNVARTAISPNDEATSGVLEIAYITIDIANTHLQRIEALKHGVIPRLEGNKAWPIIEQNCATLKNYIQQRTIPASQDAKDVIDKELSKYKWWRL